jgi:hypothetical protein
LGQSKNEVAAENVGNGNDGEERHNNEDFHLGSLTATIIPRNERLRL